MRETAKMRKARAEARLWLDWVGQKANNYALEIDPYCNAKDFSKHPVLRALVRIASITREAQFCTDTEGNPISP